MSHTYGIDRLPAGDGAAKEPKRIGLPAVTVAAIVRNVACEDCGAVVGEGCTTIRTGKRCQPHGGRIYDWHEAGCPS